MKARPGLPVQPGRAPGIARAAADPPGRQPAGYHLPRFAGITQDSPAGSQIQGERLRSEPGAVFAVYGQGDRARVAEPQGDCLPFRPRLRGASTDDALEDPRAARCGEVGPAGFADCGDRDHHGACMGLRGRRRGGLRGRVLARGLVRGGRRSAGNCRGAGGGASRHEVIGDQASERREDGQQRNAPAPVRPAALAGPEGGGWPGPAGSGTGRRQAVAGVVLPDQRLGVGAHGAGDGADVPACVEVCAAGGEVIRFDSADDPLPDAGPLADLGSGETSLAPRRCQDRTDAHATPPPPGRALGPPTA